LRVNVADYFRGFGILLVALLLLLPLRTHVNTATIALAFLIVVLLIATAYGSFPAVAVSGLSMLLFNYFFIPPYHTFMVADPQNWVVLFAFLVTSVIAGGLSAKEKRRAQEAGRLYTQLQLAFEKASEAEALKQSERLKSALLDAVSHDLRTPLTSMKAAVTTVLDGIREPGSGLDEEGRRELLEVVDAEIDRMNRLIEELIQMARIEGGAFVTERSLSSIDEIVANALTRSAGITAKHSVVVNLENGLPLLRMDRQTIAEVIYILIENATKFSPANSQILLDVSRRSEEIVVSVQDQGSGVSDSMRHRIFDKFVRGPSPQTQPSRPPGVGMGLSIARAIVEAHGGRIQAENTSDGIGSRFSFTIPLQQDSDRV
jgi:K+-sensing histidine kinase KdpD